LNFGQTIWDKIEVLLGTFWGTHMGTFLEIGNMLRTHWEQGKKNKNSPHPHPTSKRKKQGPS
jgi:hypothetical protein